MLQPNLATNNLDEDNPPTNCGDAAGAGKLACEPAAVGLLPLLFFVAGHSLSLGLAHRTNKVSRIVPQGCPR